MLCLCSWGDRASLLVDAADEKDAVAVATEVAEGVPPARVTPLPARFFVAELVFEEDDDGDGETLTIEPFPHVAALLDDLDDAAEEPTQCQQTAEYADEVVFCMLDGGHDGRHRATSADGCTVEWD